MERSSVLRITFYPLYIGRLYIFHITLLVFHERLDEM